MDDDDRWKEEEEANYTAQRAHTSIRPSTDGGLGNDFLSLSLLLCSNDWGRSPREYVRGRRKQPRAMCAQREREREMRRESINM